MQSAISGRTAIHVCRIPSCATMWMTDVDLFIALTGLPLYILRSPSSPLRLSFIRPTAYRFPLERLTLTRPEYGFRSPRTSYALTLQSGFGRALSYRSCRENGSTSNTDCHLTPVIDIVLNLTLVTL
ncbi:hypothetical protein HBI56_119740 [Parastagonospora nodorum]|uniref:Uncharacterized protein n=1 Tax=Phaeosphaeria nodorum (strain SN15 / ATCC MYA-4574 / FGSC 10173) TaxID=321614 RepID=A0A7U2FBS5_PHANO|nr:hypothetical protein HBH56_055020 [Parastagonospora nodorum]QRD02371.1 hypothetical protein JI435_417850 [Parastagonospora nodorum SN15]KAH3935882.1 hypothetical protein HBH54_040820 [Parastagonospora nodorum]KAH3948562.1 hypothetical protein HBH53_098480 [Parastagonospora nodorum]KAH3969988.1 hypothetical protein HBH51_120960 [Parastagonospora nodorum]